MYKASSLALFVLAANLSQAQLDPKVYEGMKWREIGPYRGGRSCAVSGVPGRPNEFYGGFTGGGVWKSTDAGQKWACVSDGFFKTGSVGALAVSESNPDIVVAGMGETELRGNISPGDGVYRSTDAGKSWTHLGLEQTRFISRVRIHPKDPMTMWVAALGPVYGPSSERGIFKTTDGGLTWKKTLYVDDRSGAVDLSIDASDPKTMYAATWTAWRTPYSLNSGGPGSKIFKSTDGGETWTNISSNVGLPSGVLGKVGIAVSPANPKKVYAMIESAQGGLYSSDDAGSTWKLINKNADMRQRPWYYTRVYADPKDEKTVYVLNVAYYKSTDGGVSVRGSSAQHSDHHDMWIDPSDTSRMISGNDGGVTVSTDGGRTWSDQDIPTAQFYHVSTDNAFPYRILGAQQDNSTVRIPSRTFVAGIPQSEWTSTAGGESGYVAAKPDNPDIVLGGSYGGHLSLVNHRTNQGRTIDPWPDNPMGAGAENLTHRFQWTYPIVFSPHDPNLVYTCSQYVMVSRNLGGSWTKISPDLTRNDKATQKSSGGPITQDNSCVEYYGTVFTVAESPKRKGMIWAGSDDGLIHVTTNSGKSWTNVTPAGMPKWGLVSMIEPSPFDANEAIAAVDNHENNDHAPYIYRTTDGGKTWSHISNGIPNSHFVRVVRYDPAKQGVLYAGTEFGIFVSLNNGAFWQPLQLNLPIVPIHDLAVKDNDLIAATHGRSFWVLDDVTPLHQQASSGSIKLFDPRPGLSVNFGPGTAFTEDAGKNPPSGLGVSYYLPKAASSIKVEMIDAEGFVVASTTPPGSAGFNRTFVQPRYPGFFRFPNLRMWSGGPGSLKAPPGKYKIRLTVDGATQEVTAEWKKDPRSESSDKDLVEQYKFSLVISAETSRANRAVVAIRALRDELNKIADNDSKAQAAVKIVIERLTSVEEAIYQTKAVSSQDFLNYPIRLNNKLAALLGVVQSGNFAPTRQSYDVFGDLSKQLWVQLDKLKNIANQDMPKVSADLKALGKSAPDQALVDAIVIKKS